MTQIVHVFQGVLLLVSLLLVANVRTDDQQSRVDELINTVVLPATHRFLSHADMLDDLLAETCNVEVVAPAYRRVVSSFSRVEYLRLGKLAQHNRLERLFFWPDRKSIGQRQMRRFLQDPDLAFVTLDQLQNKSVALQGLPALGRLLFSEDMGVETNCQFARLIAMNISAIAQDVHEDWQPDSGISKALIEPQPGTRYRTHEESTSAVITAVASGLQSMVDRKLSLLIRGIEQKRRLVSAAPFYHGELTMENLNQNLSMMAALLLDSSATTGATGLQQLAFEFRTARTMLEASALALEADDHDVAWRRLQALRSSLQNIREVLNLSVMPSLGVAGGFNSDDGD